MSSRESDTRESPGFQIRHVNPGDAPHIVPLLSSVGFPAKESAVANRIRSLSGAGEHLFAAITGETIAGIATLHLTPALHRTRPVGRITLLVVADDHRGVGIGRALVETCERVTFEAGGSIVEVISNLRYAEAHDFYRRLGYEMTSHKFKKILPGLRNSQAALRR